MRCGGGAAEQAGATLNAHLNSLEEGSEAVCVEACGGEQRGEGIVCASGRVGTYTTWFATYKVQGHARKSRAKPPQRLSPPGCWLR